MPDAASIIATGLAHALIQVNNRNRQ